jgi:enamine deaminase RidA (YjgF/YER057c/UK114 family)
MKTRVLFLALASLCSATAAGAQPSGATEPASIRRLNPGVPPAAPSSFSRLVAVPAGARLYYLTGQAGSRKDGTVPATFEEQVEQALANVGAILASERLDASNIVKVTFYQTERATDRVRARNAWLSFVKGQPPATTLLFVSALSRPEYKFEIDVVAAAPNK